MRFYSPKSDEGLDEYLGQKCGKDFLCYSRKLSAVINLISHLYCAITVYNLLQDSLCDLKVSVRCCDEVENGIKYHITFSLGGIITEVCHVF